MDSILNVPNSKNEKKSALASIIMHLVIFLMLLIPIMRYQYPPPEQQAVLVSFGEPNVGEGDQVANSESDNDESGEEEPEEDKEVKSPAKEETKESEKKASPPVTDNKKVKTTEDPDAIALQQKRKAEADAAAKKKAAEDAARKAAEEEAARKAAEEARKKAEFDAKKKQYGDLFGTSKGSTGNEGKQGDPGGDPDASALEGLTTGSGKIGGGLGNRSVLYEPEIQENSQKQGKVVIKLCVDSMGNVIDPKFTQKGSTTTDADLIRVAIAHVEKYKFSPSDIDKQCGSIEIDFKVK